jgi:hypothetical protein
MVDGMDLDSYLVNVGKNYCIRRKDAFQLTKNYKLKAVKGDDGRYYVLFADVYKEFIKRAFEYNKLQQFKVQSQKVKEKLKSGWKSKSSKLETNEKMQGIIIQELAATTIQRRFLRKLQEKKAKRLAKNMEFDK